MPDEALLEVRGLCAAVAGRAVLSNVAFSIAPGELVGLCGDSGCGKTTLALALLKLLPSPPWTVNGEVLLRGRDLLTLPEKELERVRGARIGFVLQDALLALNPVLRIRTQLAEVVRAHGGREELGGLLALAGLPDADRILRSYPHQLSGGERQRVTIAQAIACRPELIVADEPFTALDGPRVLELIALFRHLRQETGASLLVISHSAGVLANLADRVLRLHEGRMVEAHSGSEALRGGG